MVDAVEHGQTGLLVDPTDKNAMAEGLSVLLQDQDRREAFGRNSRLRSERYFSSSEQARSYAALYAELLR
jgi:glycosyltransferase involved in cell wall biosynthesis